MCSRQGFADGYRDVGGGLRHLAVVVVHLLRPVGFERQASKGHVARLMSWPTKMFVVTCPHCTH